MASTHCYLALLVLLVATVGCQGQACDQMAVFLCLGPLASLSVDTDLVALDAATMTQICTALPGVTSCLGDKLERCEENVDMVTVSTTMDAFNFLCKDPKAAQTFLNSANCTSKPEIEQKVEACTGSIESDLQSLSSTAAACRAINAAYQCAFKEVAAECGEEAATVLVEFSTYAIEFLTDSINCDIDIGVDSTGGSSTVGVGLALLLGLPLLAMWV